MSTWTYSYTRRSQTEIREMSEAERAKALFAARCCVCSCSIVLIAMAATFLGLYAKMWSEAIEFGDKAANYDGSVPYYDRCPGIDIDSFNTFTNVNEAGDTKWTVIFTFNTIVYACMITFSICQIIGTYFWPMCLCAACGHCALASAHFAAVVVTGVFRYQDEGEKCTKNGTEWVDFDWTFKDHGDRIQGLFISQCVLLILFNCLWICACQFAGALSSEQCQKAFGKGEK